MANRTGKPFFKPYQPPTGFCGERAQASTVSSVAGFCSSVLPSQPTVFATGLFPHPTAQPSSSPAQRAESCANGYWVRSCAHPFFCRSPHFLFYGHSLTAPLNTSPSEVPALMASFPVLASPRL
ncbi:MAG TPA: hypothetical protein VII93_00940, partial [Anaerolineales bacterium]